jgi:transcriptional regulator with XRE-family HTH domain
MSDADYYVVKRLQWARVRARLTQRQVADRVGVHDCVISLLESGKRSIYHMQFASVVRLARVLGMTLEELCPVVAVEPVQRVKNGARAGGKHG